MFHSTLFCFGSPEPEIQNRKYQILRCHYTEYSNKERSNRETDSHDNYATWKLQCQMALMKDALWGIVNGTEVAPTEAEPLAKFNTRRDKVLAIIVLSVDPTLLYLVGDPMNPFEVWTKLADQFQKKTWANKLHLRKKLYSM